jgi:hypothetical protein
MAGTRCRCSRDTKPHCPRDADPARIGRFPQGGHSVLTGLVARADLYFLGISPVLPSRFAAVLCVNRIAHEPEKSQAVLLNLNRFTAVDTPRTPRVSSHLTPQEAQPCTHTFAADVRIARPKLCWTTGKIRIRIYFTEFRGRVQDARLAPIAGRYSGPRAIT